MSLMILRSHRDLLARQPAVTLAGAPRRTLCTVAGVFEVIAPAPVDVAILPPPPDPHTPWRIPADRPASTPALDAQPLLAPALLDPDTDCERWDGLS